MRAFGDLMRRFALADPAENPDPDLPPFQGGLIGFIGYDLAPRLERLPRRAPRDTRMPDIRMALYDTAVTVDAGSGLVHLWAWDLTGEGIHAAERRLARWESAIENALRLVWSTSPRFADWGDLESAFDRETYLAKVGRVLEYIAAGDIFQVNLSQRFAARGSHDPLELYLRLRNRSPAPFSAFLRWGDLAVVSASPEWFYQTRGERIVTRPIKGTRPRGETRGEDQRLAAELARLAQGSCRADHDRGPRTQRPRPRLPVWLGRGP